MLLPDGVWGYSADTILWFNMSRKIPGYFTWAYVICETFPSKFENWRTKRRVKTNLQMTSLTDSNHCTEISAIQRLTDLEYSMLWLLSSMLLLWLLLWESWWNEWHCRWRDSALKIALYPLSSLSFFFGVASCFCNKNRKSRATCQGAPNDRFLGNFCSEFSRVSKIFESPRTAKNFENVSWWLFVGLRVLGLCFFLGLCVLFT